jgi:hypothetical protein
MSMAMIATVIYKKSNNIYSETLLIYFGGREGE